MLSVSISINAEPIYTRTAVRIKLLPAGWAEYHIDDGSLIKHRISDGVVVLAKMMLDTIKEGGR